MDPLSVESHKGYTIEHYRWGHIARGDGNGGYIGFVRKYESGEYLDKIESVFVAPTIYALLTKLEAGKKKSRIISSRKPDKTVSSETLLYAALLLFPKSRYMAGPFIDAFARHPDNKELRDLFYKPAKDLFKPPYDREHSNMVKLAQNQFIRLLEAGGSEAIFDLATLIGDIEKKVDAQNENEKRFLKCLEEQAREIGGVPNSLIVQTQWISKSHLRYKTQYDNTRNKLGFAWLPPGRRGKRVY